MPLLVHDGIGPRFPTPAIWISVMPSGQSHSYAYVSPSDAAMLEIGDVLSNGDELVMVRNIRHLLNHNNWELTLQRGYNGTASKTHKPGFWSLAFVPRREFTERRPVMASSVLQCQNCGAPGQSVSQPCHYCKVIVYAKP